VDASNLEEEEEEIGPLLNFAMPLFKRDVLSRPLLQNRLGL
jgi:hypothetical protein